MSDVKYWLCRNTVLHAPTYAKVGLDGVIDLTENPKKALRWFDKDGAEFMAKRLGWPWIAVEVTFKGDELAG